MYINIHTYMYVRALRVIVESSVLARHGWGQETMGRDQTSSFPSKICMVSRK